MPRILPVLPSAITQLCSSKQITSLQSVVLALLMNSLDADATKISIIVDFRRGSCMVEDNGCGIPSIEFVNTGGLGRLNYTSKLDPVDLHGHNSSPVDRCPSAPRTRRHMRCSNLISSNSSNNFACWSRCNRHRSDSRGIPAAIWLCACLVIGRVPAIGPDCTPR